MWQPTWRYSAAGQTGITTTVATRAVVVNQHNGIFAWTRKTGQPPGQNARWTQPGELFAMAQLIKERLAAGEMVRVMTVGAFATPKLVEAAGRLANIHGIWFDQEHCALTHGQLELLALAARAAGVDCFSRVAPTDYATVMRPMEAGCSGVMAAQVCTAEQVQQIVAWAKFAPQGGRGTYTSNAECDYGDVGIADHVARANQQRWIAIQIETREAVENVADIAAVEGVDWLFVGPSDLSVNLHVPGDYLHPTCVDALKKVADAVGAVGKPWGALCPTPEHAEQCRELGCQVFSLHSDSGCFRAGIRRLEEEFAQFMGKS